MSRDATSEADIAAARAALFERRLEYEGRALRRRDLAADPIAQLAAWIEAARQAGEPEPGAMTLATADARGVPSARTVLLKDLDAEGLTFFTNHGSQKGRELAANSQAAVCFLWHGLHRQARVAGPVERVDERAAAAYFARRPRGSQIGAWASPQSTVIADREALVRRIADTEARFGDGPIDLPPHWGGYRLRPRAVEVWQGRRSRLHDRFRYRRDGDRWILERLAP